MRFSTILYTVGAFAVAVFAAENPITKPDGKDEILAGEPYIITWTPTTKGTITLTLRQGDSKNLDTVGDIVTDAPNSGTYEWTPEKTLPAGDDYAIQIVAENGDVNYTPLISIKSEVKAKPSAKPSATEEDATKTMTKDEKPSSMPTHIPSNHTIATFTRYSNSTSSTKSTGTTRLPTATSSPSASPTAAADSGAVGVVRSPLALVACLVGAIAYFN